MKEQMQPSVFDTTADRTVSSHVSDRDVQTDLEVKTQL